MTSIIFKWFFYFFKVTDQDDNERYKTIIEKLDRLSKREAKNGAILKAMGRKIMEIEESETFDFPLRSEEDIDKLEACLSKPRFTTKIVRLSLF